MIPLQLTALYPIDVQAETFECGENKIAGCDVVDITNPNNKALAETACGIAAGNEGLQKLISLMVQIGHELKDRHGCQAHFTPFAGLVEEQQL